MIVEFGATVKKLSEQIPGIDKQFDADASAITRLHIRGLITDAETRRARQRLLRKIERVKS